jgi:hypothetical protein
MPRKQPKVVHFYVTRTGPGEDNLICHVEDRAFTRLGVVHKAIKEYYRDWRDARLEDFTVYQVFPDQARAEREVKDRELRQLAAEFKSSSKPIELFIKLGEQSYGQFQGTRISHL